MRIQSILARAVAGILLTTTATSLAQEVDIPHLQKRGQATQLIVNGQPILCLGGELHNSSSSSRQYMKSVWPRLARSNLNTVIAAVSWELIEPKEGQFDFKDVDQLLEDATSNHMHLVLLWFGSWKNGLSSYQPYWVKADSKRFPLAQTGKGEVMDILSTFGDETCTADAKAYAALMDHIRQVDTKHTVITMQVENEVGMRSDSRDHSPAADAAFKQSVPKELMDYLAQHKSELMPEFRKRWEDAGGKSIGNWEEVFGSGAAADEIFMAWNYGRYVNNVTAAGKAKYPIPMYTNSWLDQPAMPTAGEYPSGGPLSHLLDVWHAAAPSLDFLAPDLYVREFAERCAKFTRGGNPLFLAETNGGGAGAVNALFAFGKYNAICFSPFGIDGPSFNNSSPPLETMEPEATPFAQCYAVLAAMTPLILEHENGGSMTAFLLGTGAMDESATSQEVTLGDYTLTFKAAAQRPGAGTAPSTRTASREEIHGSSSGLLISIAPDEFYLVSTGVSMSFAAANKSMTGKAALESIDEGTFENGQWVRGRRLNGDEDDHDRAVDRVLRIPFKIFRVKLYQRP